MNATVTFVPAQLNVDVIPPSIATSTGTPIARDYVERDPYEGEYAVTPSEQSQTLETADLRMTGNVVVGAISHTYVGSEIDRRDSTDLVANGDTVTVPAGFYEDTETKSVVSGSATTPATTITVNPAITVNSDTGVVSTLVLSTQSITPTVEAGYVSTGTAGTITISGGKSTTLSTQSEATIQPTESEQVAVEKGKYTTGEVKVGAIPPDYVGSGIEQRSSSDLTVSGGTITAPSGYYGSNASKTVGSGTVSNPTATKGTVSNHSVSITPSVTSTAGYIAGGTKTGTAVTVSASELVSGSETKTSNGTYDVTNLAELVVNVSGSSVNIQSNKTVNPATSQTIVQPDSGYDALAKVTVNAMPSGTVTAPTSISGTSATVSTGTNTLTLTKTVSVTPNVTTAGYVSSGTAGDSSVSLTASVNTRSSSSLTVSGATVTAPSGYYGSNASATVASGSAGTPTATKGTVSNHSVSVTPSVTNTTGYITGSTKTGTAVTVSASELVSGSETKTANGTYDVTNLAQLIVNVSGGGGSVSFDTKTTTASNYPVSLEFSSMKGQPKAFVCRLNAQVSSSGNTTYYYIVDISAFGTTTHGNCFRIGGTRRVDNITSGYSWSYSGTTLTITSSAASRSASPGAF